MLFSGIPLPQLGAVTRQVVLDRAVVWKQLGSFIQHHLGLLDATSICTAHIAKSEKRKRWGDL
jgi:hypothetical protein